MFKRNSGLTLIELMTTLAMVLVLVSVGVPAMKSMANSGRTTSHANKLVTALNLARSEAVKRGRAVQLCSVSETDKNKCGTATEWTNGWLVWVDSDPTTTGLDNSSEIIRAWSNAGGAPNISASTPIPPGEGIVEFEARGELAGDSSAVFVLYQDGCTGKGKREVTVSPIGQVRMERKDC